MNRDFGAEIKRVRGDCSQQEFARLLGIGRTSVMRYESGERIPDAEFLFKLHSQFGVDPTRVVLGRVSVHIVNQEEMALLDSYRAASDEDQRAIERMAALAALAAELDREESAAAEN